MFEFLCKIRGWICWIGLTFILSSCGETTTETVELGYTGRARLDPFLAASMLLEADGREARSQPGMPLELDRELAMIVLPASTVASEASFNRLLEWVASGGSAVICLEGAASYSDYPEPIQWGIDEDTLGAIEERLEELNISIVEDEFEASELEQVSRISPEGVESSYELNIEAQRGLALVEDSYYAESVSGRFVATTYGYGTVSVLSHAKPLRNRYLRDHDHAAFLMQLSQLAEPYGEVVFVYGSGGSFWSMLWEHSWRVLVALLILLLVWLWKSSGRFGPVLRPVEGGHRLVRQQLLLSGGFFRKSGRLSDLLLSARERVRKRALRLEPHWAKLTQQELVEKLAERCALKPAKVARAMGLGADSDATSFISQMRTLQALQKLLSDGRTDHQKAQQPNQKP